MIRQLQVKLTIKTPHCCFKSVSVNKISFLGLCNASPKGVLRRRTSSVSKPKLATPGTAQSCPTSPRKGRLYLESKTVDQLEGLNEDEVVDPKASPNGLSRSASAVTNFRPRSSPAGLYSYTGRRLLGHHRSDLFPYEIQHTT